MKLSKDANEACSSHGAKSNRKLLHRSGNKTSKPKSKGGSKSWTKKTREEPVVDERREEEEATTVEEKDIDRVDIGSTKDVESESTKSTNDGLKNDEPAVKEKREEADGSIVTASATEDGSPHLDIARTDLSDELQERESKSSVDPSHESKDNMKSLLTETLSSRTPTPPISDDSFMPKIMCDRGESLMFEKELSEDVSIVPSLDDDEYEILPLKRSESSEREDSDSTASSDFEADAYVKSSGKKGSTSKHRSAKNSKSRSRKSSKRRGTRNKRGDSKCEEERVVVRSTLVLIGTHDWAKFDHGTSKKDMCDVELKYVTDNEAEDSDEEASDYDTAEENKEADDVDTVYTEAMSHSMASMSHSMASIDKPSSKHKWGLFSKKKSSKKGEANSIPRSLSSPSRRRTWHK